MDVHPSMECGCDALQSDHGPTPFVASIPRSAGQNRNFRTAFWTGTHLQMTLMDIPIRGEIGLERHPDTDQVIRVEGGEALILMGTSQEQLAFQRRMSAGDAAFVPAGTWHNVRNIGCSCLKISSIYAPPKHPHGTVHRAKADAAYE
jgi:mannose-6-phosphate isomerase-like protein (cupin superfamily)